ncbi:MAG: rhodanese-like domain-containing protein [Flavobacteriales bacterium]|nr:rhodanese-like domain-containing protein [Flavobacteriales bacterium]
MKRLIFAFSIFLHFGVGSNLTAQKVTLSPVEFDEALKELKELRQPYVLLDVRTPSEFKSGHLEGAQLLNWQAEDFKEKFKALNISKSTPIFVYCYMGGRSAEASEWIKSLGYAQVTDMKGGMYQWLKQGLPVAKNK